MQDKSKFLKIAIQAARIAGKITTHYFNKGFLIEVKKDNSPVTIADKEAETAIREHIHKAFPSHGFLGEEQGGNTTDLEYTWIIDPIDGTKNFTHKLPFWATEIALMHKNKIIAGVSYAPLLNKLLYAERNKGAYLNDQPIHVSSVESVNQSFVTFGSIRHFYKENRINSFLKLTNDAYYTRGFGDTWSHHLLAAGHTDAMLEGYVNLWDIAAVSIIVEEAGGKVTDLNGKPIDRKTSSLLSTNGALHSKILKYFRFK